MLAPINTARTQSADRTQARRARVGKGNSPKAAFSPVLPGRRYHAPPRSTGSIRPGNCQDVTSLLCGVPQSLSQNEMFWLRFDSSTTLSGQNFHHRTSLKTTPS